MDVFKRFIETPREPFAAATKLPKPYVAANLLAVAFADALPPTAAEKPAMLHSSDSNVVGGQCCGYISDLPTTIER